MNIDPKKFSTNNCLFRIELNASTQKEEQQHYIVLAEINGFFATKNLKEETHDNKVLNWWNLNKTKYTHLASFTRKYLAALLSFVYSQRLFSGEGNLHEKKT